MDSHAQFCFYFTLERDVPLHLPSRPQISSSFSLAACPTEINLDSGEISSRELRGKNSMISSSCVRRTLKNPRGCSFFPPLLFLVSPSGHRDNLIARVPRETRTNKSTCEYRREFAAVTKPF